MTSFDVATLRIWRRAGTCGQLLEGAAPKLHLGVRSTGGWCEFLNVSLVPGFRGSQAIESPSTRT